MKQVLPHGTEVEIWGGQVRPMGKGTPVAVAARLAEAVSARGREAELSGERAALLARVRELSAPLREKAASFAELDARYQAEAERFRAEREIAGRNSQKKSEAERNYREIMSSREQNRRNGVEAIYFSTPKDPATVDWGRLAADPIPADLERSRAEAVAALLADAQAVADAEAALSSHDAQAAGVAARCAEAAAALVAAVAKYNEERETEAKTRELAERDREILRDAWRRDGEKAKADADAQTRKALEELAG